MIDPELQSEPELEKRDEIRANLQQLKSHPGYIYMVEYIKTWKEQVLGEILSKDKAPSEKGEFKAYGRVLNLPDHLIHILSSNVEELPNLDAYKDLEDVNDTH